MTDIKCPNPVEIYDRYLAIKNEEKLAVRKKDNFQNPAVFKRVNPMKTYKNVLKMLSWSIEIRDIPSLNNLAKAYYKESFQKLFEEFTHRGYEKQLEYVTSGWLIYNNFMSSVRKIG